MATQTTTCVYTVYCTLYDVQRTRPRTLMYAHNQIDSSCVPVCDSFLFLMRHNVDLCCEQSRLNNAFMHVCLHRKRNRNTYIRTWIHFIIFSLFTLDLSCIAHILMDEKRQIKIKIKQMEESMKAT